MSSTTRSTSCAPNCRSASSPSAAWTTLNPSFSSGNVEHLANGVLVVDEQDRGGGFGHRRSRRNARIALQWRRTVIPHAVVAPAAARSNAPSTRASTAARSSFVSLPLSCSSRSAIVRPGALPAPLLPPNFDGGATRQLAADFATSLPDRSPGGPAAVRARQWFRDQMAPYDLPVSSDTWTATIAGLGAVAAAATSGRSRADSRAQAIVVMAHRDDTGRRAGGERQRDRNGGARRARAQLCAGSTAPARACARRTRSSSSRRTAARSAGSARVRFVGALAVPRRRDDQPRRDRRARRRRVLS